MRHTKNDRLVSKWPSPQDINLLQYNIHFCKWSDFSLKKNINTNMLLTTETLLVFCCKYSRCCSCIDTHIVFVVKEIPCICMDHKFVFVWITNLYLYGSQICICTDHTNLSNMVFPYVVGGIFQTSYDYLQILFFANMFEIFSSEKIKEFISSALFWSA